MIPLNCPKCGAKIERKIKELKLGGFIFLEYCPRTAGGHYRHYRDAEFEELHFLKDDDELKTPNGFELIKAEELHKLKEVATFIIHVRSSVSKSWRLLDKLEKMLTDLENQK